MFKKKEKLIRIDHWIRPDTVLSPTISYDRIVEINFLTDDNNYGRILFEKLDSLKICRGEGLPYKSDTYFSWLSRLENSRWLKERYIYESKYYGNTYNFSGNVKEMLSEFNHYVFEFHDEFIEVIASGFWIEKNTESLYKKSLTLNHPFLPINNPKIEKLNHNGIDCEIRINTASINDLTVNARYCSQTLFEFALILDNDKTICHTLSLSYINNRLSATLRDYFGNTKLIFEPNVSLDRITPFIKNYISEVSDRRKY
ncbi:hypothetical protein CLV96_3944 [Leptospira meyeri]|uniref:Uncharacterized protein n=1 Tax=Leptospira meyeri TaxID=29508 RepID=A0A4R8MIN6_LEPME|nr:hypothetical protein [Leptospira meyeri]EKJ86113.1 hypothetical protein LEP1GSC017_4004 [Leptospira meyeri serovar Hardjo str. Went 5]TDY66374.1 hypothetical protein CLV96_3944 [Leptospira meyeri]